MEMTIKKLKQFDKPVSSWELHVGLNTMNALRSRGIVRCTNHGALGSWFSPQTVLRWELIDQEK